MEPKVDGNESAKEVSLYGDDMMRLQARRDTLRPGALRTGGIDK